MRRIESAPNRQTATEINGVALYTRDGKPKSRYAAKERLKIMGATEDDLAAFIDLFAPRRPLYAVTTTDDPRSWTTARGRLSESDVLRHLVGDLIPSQCPRWIAPKSWETTQWIGIDVDCRGDREDFKKRCQHVKKALHILKVPEGGWLVTTTPSGGRHYRFFLTRHIRVSEIPRVLRLVGLEESSGQIELFPRENKGLRLPFGCNPGRKHDPTEWVTFIRNWKAGNIPQVDWLDRIRLAERHAQSQSGSPSRLPREATKPPQRPRRQARRVGEASPVALGLPKWKKQAVSGKENETDRRRYFELLSHKTRTPSEADELLRLGIRAEGTRYEVTKRLAWHLVRVERLSEQEAGDFLCDWVYETGRDTSRDVKSDRQNNSRKVEEQTRGLVKYAVGLPREQTVLGEFAIDELDAMIKRFRGLEPDVVAGHISFALNFLRFSKLNGQPRNDGWECCVAIQGIVRKWPGCSGMRYKPKMDWLLGSNLAKMTREKRQTGNVTGRPRTYLMRVPVVSSSQVTLSFEEAEAYIQGKLQSSQASSSGTADSSSLVSDRYGRIIPPNLEAVRGEPQIEGEHGEDSLKGTGRRTGASSETRSTGTPQVCGCGPRDTTEGIEETEQTVPQPVKCLEHRTLQQLRNKSPAMRRQVLTGQRTPSPEATSLSDFRRHEAARLGLDMPLDTNTGFAGSHAQVKKRTPRKTWSQRSLSRGRVRHPGIRQAKEKADVPTLTNDEVPVSNERASTIDDTS